jgi:methylase of polypeptide subunit release factors
MGAIAAGVSYIGTDVDAQTVAGNTRLAHDLGEHAPVQVVCSRAEVFDPGPVDFVFTSPPYFDQERYSHNEEQSWVQYGTSLEAWVEGFLRPVTRTAYRSLAPGRFMALNVADVRQGRKTVPLVQAVVDTALQEGFTLSQTLHMPLARVNRAQHAGSEPVLVFTR